MENKNTKQSIYMDLNQQQTDQSLEMIDMVFSTTIGQSMHNAITAQHKSQIIASSSISSACANLLEVGENLGTNEPLSQNVEKKNASPVTKPKSMELTIIRPNVVQGQNARPTKESLNHQLIQVEKRVIPKKSHRISQFLKKIRPASLFKQFSNIKKTKPEQKKYPILATRDITPYWDFPMF